MLDQCLSIQVHLKLSRTVKTVSKSHRAHSANWTTYPQISLLVFPAGIFQTGVSKICLPSMIRSFRFRTPSDLPSRRMMLRRGSPTVFAACAATSKHESKVNTILLPAVVIACTISSTPYAGLAPLIRPPTRKAAHMATGYQTLLVAKRETVSPGLRP